MRPLHHQNQDTNDKFMANIQRNGTFSVVPRIAAGEISPDGLIVIGQVAKKYGLYTKVRIFARINPAVLIDHPVRSLVVSVSICLAPGRRTSRPSGRSSATLGSRVGTLMGSRFVPSSRASGRHVRGIFFERALCLIL
jgi:nitrite reductase (NAD(P)H)